VEGMASWIGEVKRGGERKRQKGMERRKRKRKERGKGESWTSPSCKNSCEQPRSN